MKEANAAVNAKANAIGDALNSGKIHLRTGAQPATADDAATGTLLAELTFAADAFGAAVAGVISAAPINADPSANNTGTAGYARVLKSDDTPFMDLSVGVGSGDLQLNTLAVQAGVEVTCDAFTYTQPKA